MTRSGSLAMNRSTSRCVTAVPVGLFGFATNTSRVRSVILSAIASRSCVKSRSGTMMQSQSFNTAADS